MLLMMRSTVTRTREMLPWQLVQQPGAAAVMVPDYNGCQQMTSDGDVLKQTLTAACNNKHHGLYSVHYLGKKVKSFMSHKGSYSG